MRPRRQAALASSPAGADAVAIGRDTSFLEMVRLAGAMRQISAGYTLPGAYALESARRGGERLRIDDAGLMPTGSDGPIPVVGDVAIR